MAVEKLVLEASLRDDMSSQLKKIQKELGAIGVSPGMSAANGWLTKLGKEASGFVSSGGGAAGVLGAMGIGGLTAAASLAGMVEQFKKLTDQQLGMKELARQTGLTIDQVNQLSHAGAHFGVGGDMMKSMLDSFAAQMPALRRGEGELYKDLATWLPLRNRMRTEGIGEALLDGLRQAEEIAKTKGPIVQKEFLNSLFPGHAEAAERLFGDGGVLGFLKELEKTKGKLSPISPELLKAEQDFRDAMGDLNIAFENFENTAGPKFLSMLGEIAKQSSDLINTLAGKHPADDASKKDHKPHDKSFGENMGDFYKWEFRKLGEGWDWFSKKTEDTPKVQKQSYNGSNGLLHNASFGGGVSNTVGGNTALEASLATGTKLGFLAAFRELSAISSDAGGMGKGMQNASWGASGTGGGGHGGGGGGGSGFGDPTGEGGKAFRGKAGIGKWWTADRVQHAVERLKKEAHLSQAGAEGLVSRWASVEAAGGPKSVNPISGARGIGQWLSKDRIGGFTADYDSQISHAVEELNGKEARAAKQLRKAQNARDAAIGATMYERAEGWNNRAGTDNFTSQSEAAHAHIHELIGKNGDETATKDPRTAPSDMPQRASGLHKPKIHGEPKQEHSIRADIHVHGPTQKTSVRSSGLIESRLHRWPNMTTAQERDA
jgi:hypothetical protein